MANCLRTKLISYKFFVYLSKTNIFIDIIFSKKKYKT